MPAAAAVGTTQAVLYLEGPAPSEPASTSSPSAGPSASTSPTPTGSASPTPADAVGPGEGESSSLVAIGAQDQEELWRLPLASVARSGVTVDDTNAYVGDQDGHVIAVSLADGTVTWSADVPGRVDTPVAVSDGTVVAVARDADAARVTIEALDAATGQELWNVVPQATATIGSAPAAAEGAVVVGSADRLLRSLATADGTERWASLVLSFFSPATVPALASGSVFATDVSGGLYRMDAADGTRIWSHQLNEVIVRGAPVVVGPTVLIGLNDGRLVAVDRDSGHLVWQSAPSPGLIGTIALGADVAIAVKGGEQAGLIAFEPDPGGALIDVPSPTELQAGTTLGRYGLAAVIVFVAALVPGIVLGRRLGPADLGGGKEEDVDEDELDGDDQDSDDGELDEGDEG